jgi:hypothetical protein
VASTTEGIAPASRSTRSRSRSGSHSPRRASINDADGHYLARALVVVNFEHLTHLLQGGGHRPQRVRAERVVLQERNDLGHGRLLGIPLPFQSGHHLLSKLQKLGDREHLPIGFQTLQRAVVRVHDFIHLLIIALGQGAAAKRDDAPARTP